MTARTQIKIGLPFTRARHAHEPFSIRELRSQVSGFREFEIQLGRLSVRYLYGACIGQVVSGSLNAQRVSARQESASRKGVASLLIGHDIDCHGRVLTLHSNKNAFHQAFFLRTNDACQRRSSLSVDFTGGDEEETS